MMQDEKTEGRIEAFREILDTLTSPEHGGRTEAYEATVAYIKEALA